MRVWTRPFVCLGIGLLLGLIAAAPPVAAATETWWNKEFGQRTRITLNTSAAGVPLREAQTAVALPLRLHSGNFDFVGAQPDGRDLRVLAADGKTALPYWIERFDGNNELAVVWAQVPSVAPASDKNVVYVYAGNPQAAAEARPAAAVFDAGTAAAFHFSESDGAAADHTGTLRALAPAAVELNGLIGPSARLAGSALEWPASPRVRAAPGAPYAVSLWARLDSAGGTLFSQGPLALELAGSRPTLRLGGPAGLVLSAAADLPAGVWTHLAVTLGAGKATLYINGAQAAQGDLPANAPAIEGPLRAGAGFNGLIDELQIATAARSVEWIKLAHAAQSADAKLVAAVQQTPDNLGEGGGGHGGYMGILVANLTVDAWVVIVVLAVMFVVACWVMVAKALLVGRVDKGNHRFLEGFRSARDVLAVPGPQEHPNSSLARLYDAGRRELDKRDIGNGSRANAVLSGASLDAVKAAVDADLVRENHKLNAQMVLLTIAISGGPFLGLLGTVVGVMITFAAIAAAGDVNVNAIAPGIAAALLATVAGLAVAIPALFGYNYLAARIKNISTDMQIFVDEFVTRVAESYGAR